MPSRSPAVGRLDGEAPLKLMSQVKGLNGREFRYMYRGSPGGILELLRASRQHTFGQDAQDAFPSLFVVRRLSQKFFSGALIESDGVHFALRNVPPPWYNRT